MGASAKVYTPWLWQFDTENCSQWIIHGFRQICMRNYRGLGSKIVSTGSDLSARLYSATDRNGGIHTGTILSISNM